MDLTRVAEDLSKKINDFIRSINEAGGNCWVQSKRTKVLGYPLLEEVELRLVLPFDTNKEEKPDD